MASLQMQPRFKVGVALLALTPSAFAQIEPSGIYFNDFVGPFSGTEWFQVTPVNGSSTTFNIRDVYGGGFIGTIDAAGNIVIPGIPMDGFFSDPDSFDIFPFGGQFTFSSTRVPTTTPEFPLLFETPQAANPLLDGTWSNTLQFIDPQTGQGGPLATELITVTTSGNGIRITDPVGLFFQGVFFDGLQAGFRAVNNPSFGTPTGDFASFPGSATNIGQDLLGELNLININQFRASFLLQSQAPLGSQSQSVVEFNATRLVPLAVGDANGDGLVDSADEAIVSSLQGVDFTEASYNLAADLNADGTIDGADLAFFIGEFIPLDGQLAGATAPVLSGEGSLAANASFTLVFEDFPLSAPGFLIIGAEELSDPILGGILVPVPTFVIPMPTPPTAMQGLEFAAGIGPSVASGTELFVQGWFLDATGPQGFTASNGLLLRTP